MNSLGGRGNRFEKGGGGWGDVHLVLLRRCFKNVAMENLEGEGVKPKDKRGLKGLNYLLCNWWEMTSKSRGGKRRERQEH